MQKKGVFERKEEKIYSDVALRPTQMHLDFLHSLILRNKGSQFISEPFFPISTFGVDGKMLPGKMLIGRRTFSQKETSIHLYLAPKQ